MMNNAYTPRSELYPNIPNAPTDKMCFDNKGMVVSSGNPIQTAPVRINIMDTDKSSHNASAQVKNSKIRIRAKIRIPYIINALLTVSVTALLIVFERGFIPATKNGFFCKDVAISYKYKGDTVNSATLLIGSLLVIPLLVLSLVEYLRIFSISKICLREIWFYYKEFLTGAALVLMVTEIGKVLIGEHRPHFFDTCAPDSAQNCTKGEYVTSYRCTSTKYTDYFLVDSSKSFPSGHSSTSTFVAVFCAFLIQTRVPTNRTGRLFKPFLITLCLSWALICSLTRITDNRHHWWDVGVGILLGIFGAWYSLSVLLRQLKYGSNHIHRVATSTTTLIDIKNKDAKSEII